MNGPEVCCFEAVFLYELSGVVSIGSHPFMLQTTIAVTVLFVRRC